MDTTGKVPFPSVRSVYLSSLSGNASRDILRFFPNVEVLIIEAIIETRHDLNQLLFLFRPKGDGEVLPFHHLRKLEIKLGLRQPHTEKELLEDDFREMVEERLGPGCVSLVGEYHLTIL